MLRHDLITLPPLMTYPLLELHRSRYSSSPSPPPSSFNPFVYLSSYSVCCTAGCWASVNALTPSALRTPFSSSVQGRTVPDSWCPSQFHLISAVLAASCSFIHSNESDDARHPTHSPGRPKTLIPICSPINNCNPSPHPFLSFDPLHPIPFQFQTAAARCVRGTATRGRWLCVGRAKRS